ncbi:MAG TPA: hypothetical protein V6D17_19360 [Candidatus Obscuribacterales bacterium]
MVDNTHNAIVCASGGMTLTIALCISSFVCHQFILFVACVALAILVLASAIFIDELRALSLPHPYRNRFLLKSPIPTDEFA